jgi:hypothetical protein
MENGVVEHGVFRYSDTQMVQYAGHQLNLRLSNHPGAEAPRFYGDALREYKAGHKEIVTVEEYGHQYPEGIRVLMADRYAEQWEEAVRKLNETPIEEDYDKSVVSGGVAGVSIVVYQYTLAGNTLNIRLKPFDKDYERWWFDPPHEGQFMRP